ncbi:hypothetical protein [Sphingobacterium sp.]|uniref:hypothetical protein n=1 Tax=Sphingobacterium sp. TaxID=341027 RepID=UPI0031D00A15
MELNKNLLIERLSSKLDLQAVFLYDYCIGDEIKAHLMVVIRPVKGVSPSTMTPIVKLCMADMPEISFHVVLEGDWLSQLRNGSLYHSFASLPKHRLYYERAKEIDSLLNKKVVSSLIELNRSDYEKAKQFSEEYLAAAVEFALEERFDQSLYMLHQSLEVRIRSFYTLLGRQLGKSHNLENIIKNVRGIVPELLSVFAYNTDDVEMYRLLDLAYRACVKGESLEIAVEQYDFISTQCICLAEILDAMVERMATGVAVYRALLPADKPDEGKKSTVEVVKQKEKLNVSQPAVCEDFSGFPWPQRYKDNANRLLDAIYSKHRPEQILLVNYRTAGLSKGNPFQEGASEQRPSEELEMHLVVLMKNRGPFRFREVRNRVVCATMVFLNVSYVEKALKEGSRFVNAVWKNGWLVRKKSEFDTPVVPVEINWKAKADRVDTLVCNAEASMRNLFMLMRDAPILMDDTSLLMLHQLIDISVRTYLKCVVGFIPEGVALCTLIDWCTIVDTQVIDYLSTWSTLEKKVFILAMEPQKVCWMGVAKNFSPEARQAVLRKAKELVEFFVHLCKEAVQSMEFHAIEPIADPMIN